MLRPLSNLETAKYFNYEPRFNGVFSRNSLPTIKNEHMQCQISITKK